MNQIRVDIDECKLEIGRKRCKDQSCVNKPGWFTCEPKKPGQIKPVFQGKSQFDFILNVVLKILLFCSVMYILFLLVVQVFL